MVGFPVSGWLRLLIGVAFTALATSMAWAIERRADAPAGRAPAAADPSPPPAPAIRVGIESTYAVARWAVAVDGMAATASHQDAWSWRGLISPRRHGEVLIEAEASAAGATGEAPLHGLRIVVGAQPAQVAWGSATVVATVRLP